MQSLAIRSETQKIEDKKKWGVATVGVLLTPSENDGVASLPFIYFPRQ